MLPVFIITSKNIMYYSQIEELAQTFQASASIESGNLWYGDNYHE